MKGARLRIDAQEPSHGAVNAKPVCQGQSGGSAGLDFRPNAMADLGAEERRFAATGRTQIANFTAGAAAAVLRDELLRSPRWRHAISGSDKAFEIGVKQLEAMDGASRARINAALYAEAKTAFRYRFDRICVPDGPFDPLDVGSALGSFARFMRSEVALASLRTVTGCPTLNFADAQATRFRTGDFLTRHDDSLEGRNRRFAYVFGLTADWQPAWGGLLMYHGERGVAETMMPMFNSLCIFAVPQPHSVSFVAPYAGADRLSVSGWLFDGAAD